MTARSSLVDRLFPILFVAALAVAAVATRGDGRRTDGLALMPLGFAAMLARGRDPRREVDEQAAFEDAERTRAGTTRHTGTIPPVRPPRRAPVGR